MDEEAAVRDAAWRSWVTDQLERSGWSQEDEPKVRYLIDQFLGLGVLRTHRGTAELQTAIDIVHPLISGRAVPDGMRSPAVLGALGSANSSWIIVQPGQELNRQDHVRVRDNAYSGDMCVHNGREGSVMAVRYGAAVVHYDGEPPGTGHHHDIRLLEKRVSHA